MVDNCQVMIQCIVKDTNVTALALEGGQLGKIKHKREPSRLNWVEVKPALEIANSYLAIAQRPH